MMKENLNIMWDLHPPMWTIAAALEAEAAAIPVWAAKRGTDTAPLNSYKKGRETSLGGKLLSVYEATVRVWLRTPLSISSTLLHHLSYFQPIHPRAFPKAHHHLRSAPPP